MIDSIESIDTQSKYEYSYAKGSWQEQEHQADPTERLMYRNVSMDSVPWNWESLAPVRGRQWSAVSVSEEREALAFAELDAVLVAESVSAVRAPARRPRLSCVNACGCGFASTGANA